MVSRLARAVGLTFFMATLWPCAGSETSVNLVKTDFSATIPKEGLQENVQKTFHLGPSQTLGVFDFSNNARFLPASPSSDSVERISDEVSSSAFVFENGECNFDKVIAYTQLFPGYETPLWVLAASSVKTGEEDSETVTAYRFTNPPEKYLYGGVSFCVRFETSSTSTGSDHTATSTSKPTTKAPQSNTEKPTEQEESGGDSGGAGEGLGDEETGSTGSGSTITPPAGDSDGEEVHADSDNRSQDSDGTVDGPDASGALNGSGKEGHYSEDQVQQEQQQASVVGQPPKVQSDSAPAPPVRDPAPGVEPTESHHQSRRLSEKPETTDTFHLTIVVHSAAWSLPSGADALVASLTAMAVVLLQML
ncbi:UNVERIFIED_CONTAM: toxoplasma gondii family A protein [Hammondia hammondi]|eukprot:XP_008888234.1 toxoplasma gondii family A protein [Hammondia hammondi]